MNTRIQPASGRERAIIEYLSALDAQLIAHQDVLRERLKLIPNGWRQWRLMTTTANNLLVAIYDTLPVKTLLYMQRLCTHGEVLVRLKPAARTPEQIVASEDDLREIINVAMAAECAVCLKDDRQAKGCDPMRLWGIHLGGESMNQLVIIGNLTRAPELRQTQDGTPVCNFTVAVNRRVRAGANPEADYFRVTAWRGLGENCNRYLEKGRKVAVTGTVSARAYTGNDGGVRASLEVTAEAVEFLSSPRHNSDGEGFTEVDDAELPEGFR